MHYSNINKVDCANGEGIRLSLFVSGCRNHCKGCFQPQTWAFDFGEEYTKQTEEHIINELSKSFYDGVTILGGEPLEPENQIGLLNLIKTIKNKLPDKNVWLYTGFRLDYNSKWSALDTEKESVIERDRANTGILNELINNIDVIVDGRFIEEERDITLRFRGSKNQRLIDVKRTLMESKIINY